ncbi:hypothetical protein BDC45DRAFT_521861 [Circinella umbellata]|nr:hypothetical protein BDC45DRAFT_521861 [Circinella umbellata]
MNLDQQHHVDFISTLPFDLVGCILPQLPKQQLMECMTVSKTWRTQILECEEAWREVDVSSSSGTLDDPKFFKVTQIQAKHIRRLELLDPGDPWIKLLGDLKNLHTLLLKSTKSTFSTDLFMQNLTLISPSLKKLQISIRCTFNEEILHTIWSTCTHLTHLAIFVSGWNGGSDPIDLPILPNLIHLSLHFINNVSPEIFRDLPTVLRACPNLIYFDNNTESYSIRMLDQIRHHCPNIQNLVWEQYPLGAKAWKPVNRYATTSEQQQGFSTVALWMNLSSIMHGDVIYQFLDNNKNTLEELAIHGPTVSPRSNSSTQEEGFQNWYLFSGLACQRLHTLSFKRLEINTNTMISILRQCPSLRSVIFVSMPNLKDPVFDALLDLNQLDTLHITNGCSGLTPDGLAAFFFGITEKAEDDVQQHPNNDIMTFLPATKRAMTLKNVQFDGRLINSKSIAALSNVYSIEKLHFSATRDFSIEKQLDILPKKLVNLVEVKMFTIPACSDVFLTNLSYYGKRLERIELLALRQASDEGVKQLVDNCKSLKYLAARVCPMISEEIVMDYAHQHNICVRYAGA